VRIVVPDPLGAIALLCVGLYAIAALVLFRG
jgi:hypothetical protein